MSCKREYRNVMQSCSWTNIYCLFDSLEISFVSLVCHLYRATVEWMEVASVASVRASAMLRPTLGHRVRPTALGSARASVAPSSSFIRKRKKERTKQLRIIRHRRNHTDFSGNNFFLGRPTDRPTNQPTPPQRGRRSCDG
jgi:hypothetical protein